MQNADNQNDLVQLLRRNAGQHPERIAIRVAGQSGLTWGEVEHRARAVAGVLTKEGATGDRVALLFGTDVDFLPALFGCWYAGRVAVPLPTGRAAERIIQDTRPTMLITTDEFIGSLPLPGVTVDHAMAHDLGFDGERAAHEVAVLQYTSGSTGPRKGVLVTQHNYMHNLRMLDEFVSSIQPWMDDTQVVSWLPFFHNMGLALLLFAAWRAGTSTVIPPMSFVKDPAAWLRAISVVGGNVTAAPNFAFDLCTRRVPDSDLAGLNLSSMAVMLNAAETVRADTVQRFTARFAAAGLNAGAIAPCYGLTEGTVFVSGLRYADAPNVVRLDRYSLQAGFAAEEMLTGRPLVSCGYRPEGLTVRIVDPRTSAECRSGAIGEIWVHGPSVAAGYVAGTGDPAAFTGRITGFDDRSYLRTGDLGFLREGELFVAGRLADAIVFDDRLLFPEDIEHTVERSTPILYGRRCAAFVQGTAGDRLAVMAEVRLALPVEPTALAEIESAIRDAVDTEHGAEIDKIMLVPTGTIPVTTSGKVQRARARAGFEAAHS